MGNSTVRVRLTLGLYLLVLAAILLSEGPLFAGAVGVATQAAGFALVVTAVLWRIWATLFVAGRKEEELVREGPYAACRHPLYAGSIVAALGIGLTSRSIVLVAAVPAVVAAIVGLAARREEAVLAARHGVAFRAYRDAVPAFWPAMSRRPVPAAVTVPTAIYRKALLDAASFLALWFLVLLCDGLRSGGAWSALFRLP